MKSIVSKEMEKSAVTLSLSDDDAAAPCTEHGPASDLYEKEVKVHLRALFEGNEDAQLIVEGLFEGMEKQDFLELLDGDETRYETVRRGIRRKLAKHRELKEMIHE